MGTRILFTVDDDKRYRACMFRLISGLTGCVFLVSFFFFYLSFIVSFFLFAFIYFFLDLSALNFFQYLLAIVYTYYFISLDFHCSANYIQLVVFYSSVFFPLSASSSSPDRRCIYIYSLDCFYIPIAQLSPNVWFSQVPWIWPWDHLNPMTLARTSNHDFDHQFMIASVSDFSINFWYTSTYVV